MFDRMMKSQTINRLAWVAIPIGFMSLSLPFVPDQLNPLLQLSKLVAKPPSQPSADEITDSSWTWRRQLMHQSLTAKATSTTAPNSSQRNSASNPSPNPQRSRNYAKVQAPAATEIPVEMRVAIANEASSLAIATSTSGYVFDNSGKYLRALPAGQGVSAQSDSQTIRLDSGKTASSIWIQAAQGGYVYVGEHWYRGRVKLIAQDTGLLAVNYVNLGEYLYSVVGCEMPSSWPLSALKAQAVAARSYALVQYVRSANPDYHMGATEAWQVYRGLDGETSSTRQAVDATAGLLLSYKGGLVESLYASTDEIVARAHSGKGMSQTGALIMAQQGYDYLHILGAYYPGAGLSRIDTKESDTN